MEKESVWKGYAGWWPWPISEEASIIPTLASSGMKSDLVHLLMTIFESEPAFNHVRNAHEHANETATQRGDAQNKLHFHDTSPPFHTSSPHVVRQQAREHRYPCIQVYRY